MKDWEKIVKEIPITSASDVIIGTGDKTAEIQSALDNLTSGRTYPERIIGVVDCTLSDTIDLPSNVVLDLYGRVSAANGLNKPMFKNDGTKNYNIFLGGNVLLDLNGPNQAVAAEGLFIENTALLDYEYYGLPAVTRVLRRPTIWVNGWGAENGKAGKYAFNFDFAGSPGTTLRLERFNLYNNFGGDINLESVYDSIILQGFLQSTNGINAADLSMTEIAHVYAGSAWVFDGCNDLDIHDCFMEHNSDLDKITLSAVTHSIFHELKFRSFGNGTADTYDGIKMQDSGAFHCERNQFSNLRFDRRGNPAVTRTWHYGIEETTADQDNNQYVNCIGDDCASGALRLLGAVSKVQHQNIIGSVVEV